MVVGTPRGGVGVGMLRSITPLDGVPLDSQAQARASPDTTSGGGNKRPRQSTTSSVGGGPGEMGSPMVVDGSGTSEMEAESGPGEEDGEDGGLGKKARTG